MNKDRIEKAIEERVSPLSEYITVKIVRTQTQMRQKLPDCNLKMWRAAEIMRSKDLATV